MENHKRILLEKLKEHIKLVQEKILEIKPAVEKQANMDIRTISKMRPEDQMVTMQIRANAINRVEELNRLNGSPYFIRCDAVFEGTGKEKTYYFSKHELADASIYSWYSPVSAIRFENVGRAS